MYYLKFFFISLIIFLLGANNVSAVDSSNYINVVNPIRGRDFWMEKFESEITLKGEIEVLTKLSIPATWLIRPDVFSDSNLINIVSTVPQNNEKGLFLEITPTWSSKAGVSYKKSTSWHLAGSVFLAGYSQDERKKLIDTSFELFKDRFGYYPKSVGGWWIDSFSLDYMQTKYGISSALVVSDQYSTDNYQIWGQYWSTPYYPAKLNALFPAQIKEEKIPVVIVQWAPRDPVNAYGKGVEESTLSVQPNDYMDFHGLGTDYFSSLIDIYTTQKLNNFNQLVVGLENSYSWSKYEGEYQKQMQTLVDKQKQGQLSLTTVRDFAMWYKNKFQEVSPTQIIVSKDPLKTNRQTIWFMNPYYRAGLFIGDNQVVFKDIRQYIQGSKELCYNISCENINFATSATRVLDEVTNGNKWVLDEGKISGLNVFKSDEKYVVEYVNQTGKKRKIEFLPRDIGVDGQISSIDSTILSAIESSNKENKLVTVIKEEYNYISQFNGLIINSLKFLAFILVVILIPGLVFISPVVATENIFVKAFLSLAVGFVVLTLVTYFSGIVGLKLLVGIYILVIWLVFFAKKIYKDIFNSLHFPYKNHIIVALLILSGTIFQVIPTFFSGTYTKYGLGFWGPNAHDGLWHIALVNQLVKQIPPLNPIFSGQNLFNYHYFYDLLVASTFNLTFIPIADLIFRFYPIILSVLFGIGTYVLMLKLFKSQISAIFSVYLAYFAGSFGWMIDYFRVGRFSGESAFWSNQPVSFNLNPPFAISLVLFIALIYLLILYSEKNSKMLSILLIMLFGSLIGFKAYAAILALGALLTLAFVKIIHQKSWKFFYIFCFSLVISMIILIPNFQVSNLVTNAGSIFIFSPFWFVHSMIDSPDRVGWVRLSLARIVGLEQRHWLKFISAELIGLLIFVGGNLGIRILGFSFLAKHKKAYNSDILLFIYFIAAYSLIIPLIFIQAGNPWNVIQFLYYGLYIYAILTGVILVSIYKNFKIFGKIIVLIVLVIAPINAIATANSYIYPIPHASLNKGELEGLKFLSTQPDGIVLVPSFNPTFRKNVSAPIPLPYYETTAYVSALSQKVTYVEDEIQQEILQTDFKERITSANYFFKVNEANWAASFLYKNKIKYIYIPKLLKLSLQQNQLNLERIFENNATIIYKVN